MAAVPGAASVSEAVSDRDAAGWRTSESITAQRTHNPIRKIVDGIKMPKDDGSKPIIPLSLGELKSLVHIQLEELLVAVVPPRRSVPERDGFLCNNRRRSYSVWQL